MSKAASYQALIEQLGEQLAPVQRLWSPSRRTLVWLSVITALALALFWHFGTRSMMARWQQTPDLAWAALAALVTALTAGFATFKLGVPGNAGRWAWLPVPAAIWWLAASGLGCLRDWLAPGAHPVAEGMACLYFILGISVPLSALLVWLLRRACPLRPVLTAAMAGLASAAASAALLEICHAADAAFTDLAVHVVAIGLVVAANAVLGNRLLQPRRR